MGPERRERGQKRRKLGVKGREEFECLLGAGVNGFVRRRARDARRDSAPLRRRDRCAAKMVKLATSGRGLRRGAAKVLRGKMQARERRAGRVRMSGRCETASRRSRPHRDRCPAESRGPRRSIRRFDGGLAGCGSEDTRNRRAVRKQMREESMLLEQAFAIAHGAVMALDEDALIRSVFAAHGHDAGRGKWARARRMRISYRLAEIGELGEKRAQFGERERRPVGLDQRAVHAVRFEAVGFGDCAHSCELLPDLTPARAGWTLTTVSHPLDRAWGYLLLPATRAAKTCSGRRGARSVARPARQMCRRNWRRCRTSSACS